MRTTLIVFCADYKCSHNIKLMPTLVDQWPDDPRHSDLEPGFVWEACDKQSRQRADMMSIRR
ncbi:hypothetical protein Q3C01_13435 [Bradyrhizobium sp. UFLA05-109]